MKPAVIQIWIKGKPVTQGKFCYIDNKPFFIANMTERKWFRNYGGYGIAKQVLEAFRIAQVKPTIIYKREDLGTYYIANRTMFYKMGVFIEYGDHQQFVLPIKNWKAKTGMPIEPFNLPVMSVSDWLKDKPVKKSYRPTVKTKDLSMPVSIYEELKKRNPDLIDKIKRGSGGIA